MRHNRKIINSPSPISHRQMKIMTLAISYCTDWLCFFEPRRPSQRTYFPSFNYTIHTQLRRQKRTSTGRSTRSERCHVYMASFEFILWWSSLRPLPSLLLKINYVTDYCCRFIFRHWHRRNFFLAVVCGGVVCRWGVMAYSCVGVACGTHTGQIPSPLMYNIASILSILSLM